MAGQTISRTNSLTLGRARSSAWIVQIKLVSLNLHLERNIASLQKQYLQLILRTHSISYYRMQAQLLPLIGRQFLMIQTGHYELNCPSHPEAHLKYSSNIEQDRDHLNRVVLECFQLVL